MYAADHLVLVGLPVALEVRRGPASRPLSTASEPPVVKKTRLRSPGVRRGQPLGQLDRLRVGVRPEREVGQLAGLLGGRLGQLGAAVAGVHHEQPGEPVQVAPAVLVPDVRALAAHDDRHRRRRVGAIRVKCIQRWSVALAMSAPSGRRAGQGVHRPLCHGYRTSNLAKASVMDLLRQSDFVRHARICQRNPYQAVPQV